MHSDKVNSGGSHYYWIYIYHTGGYEDKQKWTIWLIFCAVSFLSPPVLCGAPPTVDNAFLIGRKRSHYDIHSVARYQCADGFLQRHVPTAKCRANGRWDRPKIICIKCEFYTTVFSHRVGGQTARLKAVFPFVRSFSHLHFIIFNMHV